MCMMCLSATVSFGNCTKVPNSAFKKHFQKLKNQKLFFEVFGKGMSACLGKTSTNRKGLPPRRNGNGLVHGRFPLTPTELQTNKAK